MLQKTAVDSIINILRNDTRRALRMHVPGFPKPYYCAFLLRDIEWFNTRASSGSTYRKRSDHTRNVYCDLRVGSYRYDQVIRGGLEDNSEERDSVNYISVPIDDIDYDGLKLNLWRILESKFREALEDYSQREAARLSTVDPNRAFSSFTRTKPSHSIQYSKAEKVDEQKWVSFCKRASKWMSQLPNVSSAWVLFDAQQTSKVLVSSEGSTIVQHERIFSLCATLRKLTREGSIIEQELVLNCATQKELPDFVKFKKLIREKHQILCRLMRARKIHSFSGPVLLYPIPAGLLFHEAIGHRLEGNRLLSSGEGQTFKGQVGKRIVNVPIDMYDDPGIKTFQGQRCIGSYDFDDEGTPAGKAVLVEDGILKGFLSTRAGTTARGFVPNGHARNEKYQRPISRMAVTVIEPREKMSTAQLKQLLVDEIRQQKKPFGMIVYQVAGGETATTAYNFQAFSGMISQAALVFPNGKEEVIRGVSFVGTPLQALNNIMAAGDTLELDNGFCGAESGMVPVSTISPAILLRNLELQTQEEELLTQNILPRPKKSRVKKRRRSNRGNKA